MYICTYIHISYLHGPMCVCMYINTHITHTYVVMNECMYVHITLFCNCKCLFKAHVWKETLIGVF